MRSALVFISGLAFLVIVAVVTTQLFDHFSAKKEEMVQSLPKPPVPAENEGLIVKIDPQGTIFWDQDALTESELSARLAKLAMSRGDRRISLDIDENAPTATISAVLDACTQAGITDVSLTSGAPVDAP